MSSFHHADWLPQRDILQPPVARRVTTQIDYGFQLDVNGTIMAQPLIGDAAKPIASHSTPKIVLPPPRVIPAKFGAFSARIAAAAKTKVVRPPMKWKSLPVSFPQVVPPPHVVAPPCHGQKARPLKKPQQPKTLPAPSLMAKTIKALQKDLAEHKNKAIGAVLRRGPKPPPVASTAPPRVKILPTTSKGSSTSTPWTTTVSAASTTTRSSMASSSSSSNTIKQSTASSLSAKRIRGSASTSSAAHTPSRLSKPYATSTTSSRGAIGAKRSSSSIYNSGSGSGWNSGSGSGWNSGSGSGSDQKRQRAMDTTVAKVF